MKVAHGQSLSPASGVYDLWSGTYTVNEFDTSALTIAAGTKTYKSSVVDNWNNHHISAVSIDTSSESLGPKNYISHCSDLNENVPLILQYLDLIVQLNIFELAGRASRLLAIIWISCNHRLSKPQL